MPLLRVPGLPRRYTRNFGFGLLLSTLMLEVGCGLLVRGGADAVNSLRHVREPGRHERLTQDEKEWANAAWRYFENNTNERTGLVNSIDRYPLVTMWHVGDYLAALVAARELGILNTRDFDLRMSHLLGFLNTMPLSAGVAPNKAYNAQSGVMVDFTNQPQDIGWSAVDVARLLTWMKIAGERYPALREYFDKVVLRWGFCEVIDECGLLHGQDRAAGRERSYQEGRLGYEQYASAGFAVWGFDARGAGAPHSYAVANVLGVKLHYDRRDFRSDGVLAPVLTMPHILLGLEFGWRYPGDRHLDDARGPTWRELAEEVYRLQEIRYVRQGIMTARTDHPLSQPPYFLYDSLFASGYAWNTLSDQGKDNGPLALVATRAAVGMWELWPSRYTDRLIKVVQSLYDPQKGWYEGRYEATGAPETLITLSTNAVVLETLLYKAQGKLYRGTLPPGYFQHRLSDVFGRPQRCFPHERPLCKVGGQGK